MGNYLKLFYEDALVALNTGKPFISAKRKEWETRMERGRLMKNRQIMADIIAKRPIAYQGTHIVFDKEVISGVLANMDTAIGFVNRKIDILYDEHNYSSGKH